MNRRNANTIIQEELVTLEYLNIGKITVPVRKKGERLLVEKEVAKAGTRKGIGSVLFEKNPDYEYPVITLPRSEAQRILTSELRDGTNNFRVAVPKPARKPKTE